MLAQYWGRDKGSRLVKLGEERSSWGPIRAASKYAVLDVLLSEKLRRSVTNIKIGVDRCTIDGHPQTRLECARESICKVIADTCADLLADGVNALFVSARPGSFDLTNHSDKMCSVSKR